MMNQNTIKNESWISWNPWHGCFKVSAGCLNCYVYREDEKRGRSATDIKQNGNFFLPVQKNKKGEFKIQSGSCVATCFTSDFFLAEADPWRTVAWDMIRQRPDLNFFFITKRIERFYDAIPSDWKDGYSNVSIGCTAENQKAADERLPIFAQLPIKRKHIICEPLLEKIDISKYFSTETVQVTVGGESGIEARICDYDWILYLREQCVLNSVSFWFKQTGYNFIKNGKTYLIPRKLQHLQAAKSGISINVKKY